MATETVHNPGLRIALVAADQESGRNWRVLVELARADDSVQSHRINVGGRATICPISRICAHRAVKSAPNTCGLPVMSLGSYRALAMTICSPLR